MDVHDFGNFETNWESSQQNNVMDDVAKSFNQSGPYLLQGRGMTKNAARN